MYEQIIYLRNKTSGFLYRNLLKPVFFRIDPERVHEKMSNMGVILGTNFLTRGLVKFCFSYSNKSLNQKILGISFKNPIGLSAGFDKDAKLTGVMPFVGFGFQTVGSITGEECKGNPKPRLWRLKKSKGLVVYYGLKNEGCDKIYDRLNGKKFKIPIGTSIAKTNCKETVGVKEGIKDYVKAFKKLKDIGSYNEINISCPNVFGGEPFTDSKKLDLLLGEIDKIKTKKPNFLKMASDLTKKEVDGIIEVAKKHKINGFVSTNLTKKRNNKILHEKNISKKGGISGRAVRDLSTEQVRYIYKKTKGEFVIIGCGGVFSAEDAYEKIKAGASLVSLITGMIFEGPQVISEINQDLVKLLEKDGYTNISEAIGKGKLK